MASRRRRPRPLPGEEERHPAPLRLIHWLHTFVTTGLILTGLYLSFPTLFAGDRLVAYAHLWHAVLSPLLVATTVSHIYLALMDGTYKDLLITRYDLRTAGHIIKSQLLLVKTSPQRGKYHLLQKVLYLSFLPAVAVQTVTGLALTRPPRFSSLIRLFHGLQIARELHFLTAMYIVAAVTLHVYRSVTEPGALKSMITGYGLRRPPINTPAEIDGRPKPLR